MSSSRSLSLCIIVLSVACSRGAARTPTTNPSFPLPIGDARRELAVVAQSPKPLERPLVILAGFLDLGFGPTYYATHLQSFVRGDVQRVSFVDCTTFDECRRRVVERVDRAFGGRNLRETVEVDVIGQSMGGLVGLYAGLDDPTLGKRLKIRRLYTISSPLQGAKRAARMPAFLDAWPLIRDMRPGSPFYADLAQRPVNFDVVSYTLLDDPVVGERFASLPNRGVWWLDSSRIGNAHAGADFDPRIMLDIVRRLRAEPPVTKGPPAALPAER